MKNYDLDDFVLGPQSDEQNTYEIESFLDGYEDLWTEWLEQLSYAND